MIGYMMAFGYCCACNRMVSFNPDLVPALRIDDVKQPLCRSCAEEWIRRHPEANFKIPAGAYEPAEENPLP